ncbi:MAG TPA: hypothetical protein VME41_16920 [Stellaceae bacterium]|nr:hypothetical protein [Stellaceae bacterium]
MHDSIHRDDDRIRASGRLCVIEQPAGAGECSPLTRAALAGADVVFYHRSLASLVCALLPRGRYNEPLPDGDATAAPARAVRLAADGWNVVQLVLPRHGGSGCELPDDAGEPAIGAPAVIVGPSAGGAGSYAFTANGLAG